MSRTAVKLLGVFLQLYLVYLYRSVLECADKIVLNSTKCYYLPTNKHVLHLLVQILSMIMHKFRIRLSYT